MFLPTTPAEMKQLGWHRPDVVLVTGDSYIDSPYVGVVVIGKVLLKAGYRVGIIAQPDIHSETDIARLGEPLLFWGVTGGCVDSMVANYTAGGKRRKSDDFTPGLMNDRRPDRAVIQYTNLIRRYFKSTAPVVLGGIEASLRRISHYDFWSNRIRRSILFDAKADLLVYGMGEKTVLSLAEALKYGRPYGELPGLCRVAKTPPADAIELPSHELVAGDKAAFADMFETFYRNTDPASARRLVQRQDTRFLVQNPPADDLEGEALDAVYEMDFEQAQHPYYERQGRARALDTIGFSITTHRGCYGECSFCAIGVHQGRTVHSRTAASILREARKLSRHPGFKGYIQDVGGPTANMFGFECRKKRLKGPCATRRCLFPEVCDQLSVDHRPQMALLEKLQGIPGVKRAFVRSGIRHDLVLADRQNGRAYLDRIIRHHLSGQLKVAPEHSEHNILQYMKKPDISKLTRFKDLFDRLSRAAGGGRFLTYYLIAAHPGCTLKHMEALNNFCRNRLHTRPEQVQIFTPTPSTYSSLLYWTQLDPETHTPLFVETNPRKRELQKWAVTGPPLHGRGRTRNRKDD